MFTALRAIRHDRRGAAPQSRDDLRLKVMRGSRIVRQKHGVGSASCPNVPQRVEVLGQQHQRHHILAGSSRNSMPEVLYRRRQAIDNRLPLRRNALALQCLGLRLGLRLLDLQNLLRLAASLRRYLGSLRRIDVVHRRFYLHVRNNVRHQRRQDIEPEAGHNLVQLRLHRH